MWYQGITIDLRVLLSQVGVEVAINVYCAQSCQELGVELSFVEILWMLGQYKFSKNDVWEQREL